MKRETLILDDEPNAVVPIQLLMEHQRYEETDQQTVALNQESCNNFSCITDQQLYP